MVNSLEPPETPSRSVALLLLTGLLWLETAGLAVLAGVLVTDLFTARPDSYAAAVGLLVITLIGSAWLGLIAFNTPRRRAWIRGAVVTVCLLQIAVAIGSFQGLFARPDVGWLLLAPALAILALLFTRSVVSATTERES